MAVDLTIESTGITVYDGPMRARADHLPGEKAARALDKGAERRVLERASTTIVRIDVARNAQRLPALPARPGDAMPERFQLALETVPVDAGGIWNLASAR